LPEWKQALPWLRDAPSQALQQSLKHLESSFKNLFEKRAQFPKFKKKGLSDAFRIPQHFVVEQNNNRIYIPKLGWLRYRNNREILGEIKNITVSQKCGKWYASIQTELEVENPIHQSTSVVGVDVGLTQFATLSDGFVFKSINSFKQRQARLARYQRALSRKVKFSSNWKKHKGRITKLHSTIANIRKDYLHKVTTAMSKNHAMIVIEDLQISNMSKSASGTVESKGKNVKQKSSLNRSILDQAWGEFRRQLEYKQVWSGGEVLAVPAPYTSQRCSCCGFTDKGNRTSQAVFKCLSCGTELNADLNAARNILAAGHAVLAHGENVQLGVSEKCEPAEGKRSIPSEPVGIPFL